MKKGGTELRRDDRGTTGDLKRKGKVPTGLSHPLLPSGKPDTSTTLSHEVPVFAIRRFLFLEVDREVN